MKAKKILATLVLALIISIIITSSVQAALQSMPTTTQDSTRRATPADWILSVRKMEEANGGMALNETVGTDALATTNPNNIDVHLLKNTEFGAIVLLGASDYGKQGAIGGTGEDRWMTQGGTETSGTANNLATTTGNVTGIYEIGYRDMTLGSSQVEWTAAGGTDFLSNIDSRYMNRYTQSEDSALPGDATVETKYWHTKGEPYYDWLQGADRGFIRGRATESLGAFYISGSSSVTSSYGARAGVVCGSGL